MSQTRGYRNDLSSTLLANLRLSFAYKELVCSVTKKKELQFASFISDVEFLKLIEP